MVIIGKRTVNTSNNVDVDSLKPSFLESTKK